MYMIIVFKFQTALWAHRTCKRLREKEIIEEKAYTCADYRLKTSKMLKWNFSRHKDMCIIKFVMWCMLAVHIL